MDPETQNGHKVVRRILLHEGISSTSRQDLSVTSVSLPFGLRMIVRVLVVVGNAHIIKVEHLQRIESLSSS